MLVFGLGIRLDVENIQYADLDLDQALESRPISSIASSRSFLKQPPLHDPDELHQRLRARTTSPWVLRCLPSMGGISNGATLRARFLPWWTGPIRRGPRRSSNTSKGSTPNTTKISIVVSLAGCQRSFVSDMQMRYTYNPTFRSIYAVVPSVPAILLVLIPAVLMAVSVVREKELGSM